MDCAGRKDIPAALADHLRQAAGMHYGHAIRSFLDAICQADAQELSETIRNYRESFTAQTYPPHCGRPGQAGRPAFRPGGGGRGDGHHFGDPALAR